MPENSKDRELFLLVLQVNDIYVCRRHKKHFNDFLLNMFKWPLPVFFYFGLPQTLCRASFHYLAFAFCQIFSLASGTSIWPSYSLIHQRTNYIQVFPGQCHCIYTALCCREIHYISLMKRRRSYIAHCVAQQFITFQRGGGAGATQLESNHDTFLPTEPPPSQNRPSLFLTLFLFLNFACELYSTTRMPHEQRSFYGCLWVSFQ